VYASRRRLFAKDRNSGKRVILCAGTLSALTNCYSLPVLPPVQLSQTGFSMANVQLSLVTPPGVKRTVMPRRIKNTELRTREHLTEKEVERLMKAASDNRYGHRDATMILVAFRHGLRAKELCDLRWDQVDFTQAVLHVRRVKNGTPSTHPLTGREMRALRRLQREAPSSPFMFVSERGAPFTTAGFARMMERATLSAHDIKAHPHMLRHACGYALANQGRDTRGLQAYLGHRYIQHTVRYTELSSDRFKGWWKD
jgi:integrase